MWKVLRRAAVSCASASGTVMTGASAASRSATDPTGMALICNARFSTRPMLRPGFSFSARRAHRTQHRFARPAVHLEPSRFLVGTKCGTRQHSRLAVELVGIEAKPRELALHGFDVGGAQLGRCRPRRRERLRTDHAIAEMPDIQH